MMRPLRSGLAETMGVGRLEEMEEETKKPQSHISAARAKAPAMNSCQKKNKKQKNGSEGEKSRRFDA